MKVVTAEQMRRIDEVTIRERGVAGRTLMERAGQAVAREALEQFEPDSVAIVTGKGNNAGDGFVVARELDRQGVVVFLYLLAPPEELAGDALEAYEGVPTTVRRTIAPDPADLADELSEFDLVVDAIFGTGLRGPVAEPWAGWIEAINAAGVSVLAIDIPSGLTGAPLAEPGPHVCAAMTVTIGLPKLSMVVEPGVHATGVVMVADIGFPRDLLESEELSINLMTPETARALLPKRRPGGHKGTFGRVLILGGCEGFTGAAILTARAAARSGVGLVYVAYPRGLGHIMESALVEPVKLPLAGDELWFTPAMVDQILEQASKMDAIAVGPGLGLHPETGAFLHRIVCEVKRPLVIDASGLDLLSQDLASLRRRGAPTIVTPHPKEAARLLGRTVAEVEADRLDAFARFARDYEVVTVLKGAQSIVTSPSGQRSINPSGNTGLAKGGSGDLLTGLTAGLLAQGMEAYDATRLGVFMHGMAADVTAETLSVRAMLPSDVIETLGQTFLRLEKGRGGRA